VRHASKTILSLSTAAALLLATSLVVPAAAASSFAGPIGSAQVQSVHWVWHHHHRFWVRDHRWHHRHY
jgi:Ni/Co efflux regulator RcnB